MDLQTQIETTWFNEKYKARFVVKEFRQEEGLQFFDTYSLETRVTSIKMLVEFGALDKFEIHPIDVEDKLSKCIFRRGNIHEST